jgi:hypothetical protein
MSSLIGNNAKSKIDIKRQAPVAHTSNPSYLEGRDQEDHD